MNLPYAQQFARLYADPDIRFVLQKELESEKKALMKDATKETFETHKGRVEVLQSLLDRAESFFKKPPISKGTVEL